MYHHPPHHSSSYASDNIWEIGPAQWFISILSIEYWKILNSEIQFNFSQIHFNYPQVSGSQFAYHLPFQISSSVAIPIQQSIHLLHCWMSYEFPMGDKYYLRNLFPIGDSTLIVMLIFRVSISGNSPWEICTAHITVIVSSGTTCMDPMEEDNNTTATLSSSVQVQSVIGDIRQLKSHISLLEHLVRAGDVCCLAATTLKGSH